MTTSHCEFPSCLHGAEVMLIMSWHRISNPQACWGVGWTLGLTLSMTAQAMSWTSLCFPWLHQKGWSFSEQKLSSQAFNFFFWKDNWSLCCLHAFPTQFLIFISVSDDWVSLVIWTAWSPLWMNTRDDVPFAKRVSKQNSPIQESSIWVARSVMDKLQDF